MFMNSKASPSMKAALMILTILLTLMVMSNQIYQFDTSYTMEWNLITIGSLSFNTPILFDKTSVTFSMTVLIISLSVMLFTTSYMTKEQNLEYFTIMVMLFVMSMNLLIFFPNLVTLLLGWDGLGLTSYLLVIYYGNSKSLSAGMLTALTNRIGDALLILAISWAFMAGHWNFSFSSFEINMLISALILLAAMTKSAQMPFSAWLPAAMAAPTPVSALVHSSTLVTAGIYLIIRFFPTLSNFMMLKFMCFYLGALTCMMASMSATMENDLKKIIALSTLSQLGIMMMALGLEQPTLAFFHLVTHALFKALLFICAGTMIHNENNNQDIRLMGNLQSISPINIILLNTANLSLCGIPFLAGFYSKDCIVETFFLTSMPLSTSMIMMTSICMTAAYTMRLAITTLWSPSKNVNFNQSCSKFTYAAFTILVTGAIMSGASMNWTMKPIMTTPSLPTMMKMLTLILIFSMALMMFIFINKKQNFYLTIFLSSMWFLSYISANPVNKWAMKMSKTFIYNEATWMEKMSGKGTADIMSNLTMMTQKTNKTTLSEMMTLMSFVLIIMLLSSMVC